MSTVQQLSNGNNSSGDGQSLVKGQLIGDQKLDGVFEGSIITQKTFAGGVELVVDCGARSRGTYLVTFPVPVGVTLILGQVQEGINAGDAVFSTLGTAVRAGGNISWLGRVYFKMEWSESAAVPAIGRFVLYT